MFNKDLGIIFFSCYYHFITGLIYDRLVMIYYFLLSYHISNLINQRYQIDNFNILKRVINILIIMLLNL